MRPVTALAPPPTEFYRLRPPRTLTPRRPVMGARPAAEAVPSLDARSAPPYDGRSPRRRRRALPGRSLRAAL